MKRSIYEQTWVDSAPKCRPIKWWKTSEFKEAVLDYFIMGGTVVAWTVFAWIIYGAFLAK